MTTIAPERTTATPAHVDLVDLVSTDDPGNAAHIVLEIPGKTAHALVLEARIYGTEVEALCGHRWVPQRDPKQLPICEGCLEIYKATVNPHERDELPDA